MSTITRTPALSDALDRVRGLRVLVGNTPLLAIEYELQGRPRTLYAKAENLNLTGSIKDRMAIHIVRRGYETGALEPGAPIVEATSGNTGISFSAVGRALGHPVVIFMPDWMSEERKRLIRSFGARVELVSGEQGGFLGSMRMAEEYAAATPGAFLPRQFANEQNVEAHATTTGPELWAQLGSGGLKPDAFVAGVGTGGTIMGVGRCLRERRRGVRLHPVEPSNSPTLTTGYKVGKHRIQGISDEFIPPIVHLDELDRVLSVDDGDAIIMAQRLAAELGLGVGISSGANFLAAALVREEMDDGAVVVTVLPDSNKKYLSTDLLREEPVREDFLAPRNTLRRFHAVNRVCSVCYDPSDPASAPVGFPLTAL
jgi:cysteine synthase A